MAHNFSANRLNEYVQFYNQLNDVDERGKPKKSDEFAFDCRAEVQEKSGQQLQQMGKTLDDSVISILTYFHWDVKSDQVVVFNGNRYQVDHIQPDNVRKSMIVSCSLIGSQSYDPDYVATPPPSTTTPPVVPIP